MALIELKDVTKKYDKSTTALRHIDLSVNSGEFVYLVGPSGAGKSSLIRLFYQEEKLTSGSMKVGEFDLTRLRKKDVPLLRRSIGVVFQDYKLLPKKTAFENVAYAMEVIGEKPRHIKKRVIPFYQTVQDEDSEETGEDVTRDDSWNYAEILWNGIQAKAVTASFEQLSYKEQWYLEKRNAICMTCGRVSPLSTQSTFEDLAVDFEGTTASGAERFYRRTLDKLRLKLLESGLVHTVTLKQTECRKKDKKIAAAVYLYQADNDGEWGELRFDFENGTAEIVRLADWDTVKSNIFAKTAIRFVQSLPEARLLKSVVVPFEMGVPEKPVLQVSAAKALKGNSSHTISLRQTECQKTGQTITAAVYEYLVDNDGEWGKLRFDFENGTAEIVKLADWDTVKSNVFAKAAIRFVQGLPETRLLQEDAVLARYV